MLGNPLWAAPELGLALLTLLFTKVSEPVPLCQSPGQLPSLALCQPHD